MGFNVESEREATIREGSNRFSEYVHETRGEEEYEPYWHWSERQYRYSEFNKKSMSNYMWQKWGIK